MQENQNIEWKQSWHDDYLKWVCGFANAFGGIIYIGKKDNGEVVHLTNYQFLLEMIPTKIRDRLGMICDVNLLETDAKKYIEIKVNPYSVPVSLRGRYYYRTGSTMLEMTGNVLNDFLLKKAGKTWDDVSVEGATINDIDPKSVALFLEDAEKSGRMPDVTGLSTLQILEKLRLVENNKLKRAAIILFGIDPNKFFPNILVKIGRFGADDTDLRFQEVIEGNLIQLLKNVVEQLNFKFLVKPIVFEGLLRIEKGEYPPAAIREMLLNALVHRVYMGSLVQMRVYDHKITIWNEGVLPPGLDLESLKREHSSRPRNPIIADACFKGGYIDSWGRGTLKIISSCKAAELPTPEIKEWDGGMFVTIYKTNNNEDAEGGQVGGQVGGQEGGSIGGSIGGSMGGSIDELTDRQNEVLTLISENPKTSVTGMANQLKINRSAAQKHLELLVEKGMIKRVGGTRGYWKILFNK